MGVLIFFKIKIFEFCNYKKVALIPEFCNLTLWVVFKYIMKIWISQAFDEGLYEIELVGVPWLIEIPPN